MIGAPEPLVLPKQMRAKFHAFLMVPPSVTNRSQIVLMYPRQEFIVEPTSIFGNRANAPSELLRPGLLQREGAKRTTDERITGYRSGPLSRAGSRSPRQPKVLRAGLSENRLLRCTCE